MAFDHSPMGGEEEEEELEQAAPQPIVDPEQPSNVQGGGEPALSPLTEEEATPLPAASPSAAAVEPIPEEAGVVEPSASPAPQEGLSSEDASALDYVEDVFRQIGGGASDAAENILNAGKETVFGETRDEFGNIVKTFEFDDFGAPTTTAGEVVRPVAEFLIPFIATSGMVGAAAKGFQFLSFLRTGGVFRNSILQGSIAGGITDYAALDPADGNLSTVLNEIPELAGVLPDLFIHNESDSQFEKRMKSVLEGAVLGAAAEGLMQGFRSARAARKTKRFKELYGTEKEPAEYARVAISNLVHARSTYYNVESIHKAIQELGIQDPAFIDALKHLESAERVGSAARPTPTPVDNAQAPINVWHGSGENAALSNLHPRRFTYEGREYSSVEHAFQSNKGGTFNEAVYTNGGWIGDGRRVRGGKTANSAADRSKIMDSIMREMYTQNPEAQKELLKTAGKNITHTQDRGFWGAKFPQLLHAIRNDLESGKFGDLADWQDQARQRGQMVWDRAYVEPDNPTDAAYEALSPEAKAFVDASETFAGQYGVPSRKQALETHYNTLGVDSDQGQNALKELEAQGGERGAELAALIRKIGSGNMEDYLTTAGDHLRRQEEAFDTLIASGTKGEQHFGPTLVRQMHEEVNLAYPRGYTNEITKTFDDGAPRSGIRVVEANDPLWDGKAPITAKALHEQLTSAEIAEFAVRLADNDIDSIQKYLAEITRDGKPAGFDSIFRHYQDLGAAELLDEFSTILSRATKESTTYRTQSLKSVRFEAKDLAKRTIKQIEADFENISTSIGAGKRALFNMVYDEVDMTLDPVAAYEKMAVKAQAMRMVQQYTMRSIASLPIAEHRTHREVARSVLMLNELRDLVQGSRRVVREGARSTRAQALDVENIYAEITAELGGIGKANDYLDLVAIRGAGPLDNQAMRQINLFLRKTSWRMRKEAAVQFWLGAILSAPPTQMVNVASNVISALWYQTEQVVGAMVPRELSTTRAGWRRERAAIAARVSDELYGYTKIKIGLQKSFTLNTAAKDKLWRAYKTGDFQRVAEEMATPQNQELGYFWSSLFSNTPAMDAATKFDLGNTNNAMTMDKLFPNTSQSSTWGKTLGGTLAALNAIPSGSFRMLMANDAWAKSVNYHMKLGTYAKKHARKLLEEAESRGLADETLPANTLGRFTKQDADDLIADIETNAFNWDSEDFIEDAGRSDVLRAAHEEATKYSQYATHTEAQEFAALSRWMQNRTQITPELKFILPFINTPTNLLKAIGERTPIAWKRMGKYKAAVEAGDTETLHALKARMRMGSMLWATAGTLAIDGRITGGAPSDPEQRDHWLEKGIPEYSIWFRQPYANIPEGMQKWWVGDKDDPSISHFTWGRLEPLATIFKLAADMTETIGELQRAEQDELAAVATSALADNILSQSYFEGLSRIMGLFMDPERVSIGDELEDLVASFIPNILMKGRQAYVDDGMKEAQTLWEKLKTRTPWATDLISKTNFFNEPREYPHGWAPFVNPFYSGDWVRDPVAEALDEAHYSISQRRTYGKIDGIGLTPELMRTFKLITNSVKIQGRTLKESLHTLIQTSTFKNAGTSTDLAEGGRHELIDYQMKRYIKVAQAVIRQYPEFGVQVEAQRLLEYGLETNADMTPDMKRLLSEFRENYDRGTVLNR